MQTQRKKIKLTKKIFKETIINHDTNSPLGELFYKLYKDNLISFAYTEDELDILKNCSDDEFFTIVFKYFELLY